MFFWEGFCVNIILLLFKQQHYLLSFVGDANKSIYSSSLLVFEEIAFHYQCYFFDFDAWGYGEYGRINHRTLRLQRF